MSKEHAPIQGPYNLVEVKFQRRHPGYIYRREVTKDPTPSDNETLEMVNCYSSYTGEWIGNAKNTLFICKKKGLRQVQKSDPSHCVCSIGYQPDEDKWYGWSHRAICGFGFGDRIYVERFGDGHDLVTQHGPDTITTMEQAKQAAINFGESVS